VRWKNLPEPQMNWIELIKNLGEGISSNYSFNPSASNEQIGEAETFFGHRLPDELDELYRQTNGIIEKDWGEFIFSIEKLINQNQEFRNNPDFDDIFMPFDNLLFFSSAGNGDYFCYPITKDKTCGKDIFVWNHETDERICVTYSLDKFIKGWLTSEIAI
jgi:hypothetical protein